jgi:hypothetical protein
LHTISIGVLRRKAPDAYFFARCEKNSLRPLATHSFWLPKAGNSTAEYEDAFHIGKWKMSPARTGIAIADGATEGMLSGLWAQLLVRRFVRQLPGQEDVSGWLAGTLRAWQHEKNNYLLRRERNNKPVQWYEEPGLEAGAFAALLGLVLSPSEGARTTSGHRLKWNALSVGDCFLVHVRGDDCICMFPYAESSALNNRPFLLASNPARNKGIDERFLFAAGEAHMGDRFYLMTDALAGWFLRTYEQGALPWQELDSFWDNDLSQAFADWVGERRRAHEMRNDDVTLIQFEVPE